MALNYFRSIFSIKLTFTNTPFGRRTISFSLNTLKGLKALMQKPQLYNKHFYILLSEPPIEVATVVIISWIGSSVKHLQRYIHWYHNHQLSVIVTRPPDFYHLWQPSLKAYAGEVLSTLLQLKLDKRPLFFHVFSGNATVWSYIMSQIYERKEFNHFSETIIGKMFDSSPSHLNADLALRALTRGSNSKAYWALCWLLMKIFDAVFDVEAINKKYYQRLSHQLLFSPEIFFYSKDDPVVAYEAIEHFIELEKQRGVQTVTVRWDKSVHVKHFVIHHDEYVSALQAFIFNCLKKSQPSSNKKQPIFKVSSKL